ncbi:MULTISPECIES: hypothetical protein [unclassified Bradyrhizobium]|uniref:hypothetical protein n=1 Tax=unclassified Bradyrhizobium TaxID=2631580 RepID=UPI00143DA0B7|nr:MULTISPECIES: hypothetical protein [unclassified Bradyrhizobium]
MPLYAGMTVNERLVMSGQIAATAKQAAKTADAVLANPQKYGFPATRGEPLIPSFRGAR